MKIVFESYWKIFKKNHYKSLQRQRAIRKLSLYEIKRIQWKRLKKILEYAYNNNEFYRDYFKSVNLTPDDIKGPKDILKLPITEKKTYRKYFEKNISKGVKENDYSISSTSGSSGEPFEFYIDTIGYANINAAFVLNKEAMGINPFKKTNEIVIKCEPRNDIRNLKEGIKRSWIAYLKKSTFFSENLGIRAQDITPQNIEDIVRIIKDNEIESIYGYSTSVLSLARHLSSHKVNINMNHVICIGEGLLEQQREYISKILNCPVYMDYGASECMRMGFECKYHNGYHMDIYNYYFEYLKNGIPANTNEPGEIIVTNLNNYVFPFIRYRIGDEAIVSNQSCKCGINLPLVKAINGRITDTIITPNNKQLPGLFVADIFDRLSKFVRQYQIIQVEDNELLVKIIPTDKMTKKKIKEIEKHIYDSTDRSMAVKVELVKEISFEKSGKRRLVISNREYPRPEKIGEMY